MRSRADGAPSWVFAPDLGDAGSELLLSAEESHYLVRVCRAQPGDRVEATNGHGARATLTLLDTKASVRVQVDSREEVERTATAEVWCGAPEGQRADWLVEKLGELGIGVWQPIDCERSAWRMSAVRRSRWERLAIAALRQSQRCHVLEIREPQSLAELLVSRPAGSKGWWCEVNGSLPVAAPTLGTSIGVIGPAPGFTAAEKARLESAGFSPMALSDSRLRTETAALAWSAWWGQASALRSATKSR